MPSHIGRHGSSMNDSRRPKLQPVHPSCEYRPTTLRRLYWYTDGGSHGDGGAPHSLRLIDHNQHCLH